MHKPWRSLDTLAIHAGQEQNPPYSAVAEPIVLSTTFSQPEPGKPVQYEYSRSGNPTREALERALAALEAGSHALAFASGSAASLTLLHTLRPADQILCGDDVYGGTFRLFDKVLKPLGITTRFVDLRDPELLEASFTKETKLVWIESPSNPLLKLFDIERIAEAAHRHGALLVVDNTFATPVLQQPLELGADVVVHSTTKYVNGHSDVVGGALVLRADTLAERLRFLQNALGAVPSPLDCYLTLRGVKTLPVRMRRHVENAAELARRLEQTPGVERVHYPGLPSHPNYPLCVKQMKGLGGGMISFELSAGLEAAKRALSRLKLFTLAESLGAVESLAEQPALMTHASIPAEQRRNTGIADGLIRLSVGLEDVDELWNDLLLALTS